MKKFDKKCVYFFLMIFLEETSRQSVHCENILILCPMASKSHKNILLPILHGMHARGHHVTLVSSYKTESLPSNGNVSEIVKGNFQNFLDQIGNPFKWREGGVLESFRVSINPIFDSCHQVYQNEQFMALLNKKIDLIFVESFLHDCLFGFIQKLGAPFIIVSALPVPAFTTQFAGFRLPPSFVPGFMVDFSHEMTFFQRLFNLVMNEAMETFFQTRISARSTAIYRQYLGEQLPDSNTIGQNVSMILSNSHFTMNYPRPTLPDVVEVGGIHCRPGRPLPKDLEEFVAGAGSHGFILFSLGSIVQGQMLPVPVRKIFLNVFSRLKQRVIWKWESGIMEGEEVPASVKLVKWLPQQDLLGHASIKLFMTHGGLLSTQESTYHGVPMLGIPIYADQDMNVQKSVRAGCALMLEILDVTEDILESKIQRLLNETRFSERVKEASRLYQDEQVPPLDRAVFHAEYLIRHKGAPHLRSAARKLNFWQYHSIDVMALLFTVLFVALWTFKIIILKLWNKLRRNGQNNIESHQNGMKKKQ